MVWMVRDVGSINADWRPFQRVPLKVASISAQRILKWRPFSSAARSKRVICFTSGSSGITNALIHVFPRFNASGPAVAFITALRIPISSTSVHKVASARPIDR